MLIDMERRVKQFIVSLTGVPKGEKRDNGEAIFEE